MKKIALFCSAALLALGFASCDDKSELGIPQVNPQETIMSAGGITVDFGDALQTNTLDLNQYVDQQIPVIKLALTDEEAAAIPEGSNVEFTMQLSANEDYSDAVTIPVVDGTVACADWDNFFRSKLGKSPEAKDNYVRFAAYINGGGQQVRVGTPDTWFAAKKLLVTPVPMPYVIDNKYTLWVAGSTYEFKHSTANVYDDPVFTVTFDVTEEQAAAGGVTWNIAGTTAKYGVETAGDTALEGTLVANGKDGKLTAAASYLMTINMETLSYNIQKMSYLYTPGNSNGWSQEASQQLAYNADKGYYEGYAYLDGEFKFSDQPNWNGTNYGNAGEDGKLSTDGGAGNLNAPEAGLYYVTVNTADLTYTITKITSFGAIGGFNGWGGQTVMTPSDNFLVWTGEVTFAAGDEYKFRANDNWDINLGGEISNLVNNGANLVAPGAGTYTVTVDLSKLPYTCSLTAK